jgi:hypothetical protein
MALPNATVKSKNGNIFSPSPEAAAPESKEHIMSRPYSDHNILYGPSSSGILLSRWEFDRHRISLMVNSKQLSDIFKEALPIDRDCRGCLGSGGRPYVMRLSCVGCHLVGRLLKRGEIGKNKIITIQGGEASGKQLHISHQSYSITSLSAYTEDYYPQQYGTYLLKTLNNIVSCEKGYRSRVARTRTFETTSLISNYIAISCILEHEMRLFQLPGLPIFRWAYECGDGVVVINEHLVPDETPDFFSDPDFLYANNGADELPTLDAEVAKLLLMQLTMNLVFLNNYDFTHGDPSLANVIITREPCTMKYDSIRLESPFTVHIIPGGASSITLNSGDELIRVYCSGVVKLIEPDVAELIKIQIQVELAADDDSRPACGPSAGAESACAKYERLKIVRYKIGTTTAFDRYVKHMGVALFPSSFDAYAFFLALMSENSFYYAVIRTPKLYQIWRRMWRNDEFDSLTQQLTSLRQQRASSGRRVPYHSIRLLLYQFYLRCDGLEFLWAALKNLAPS